MLPIDKDLVSEILFNKEFDWKFLIDNPVYDRTRSKEDVLLSSVLYNKNSPESKISIVNGPENYYGIAQIHLSKLGRLWLVDYDKLLDYSKKYHTDRLTAITDINNPFFNVEWCFKIEDDLWKTINEDLIKIEMPARLVGPQDYRKTLWVKHSSNHLLFDWHSADPRLFELENFMYSLLNIALEKISKAYIRQ